MEEITRGVIENYRIESVVMEQGKEPGDRFLFTITLTHPKAPNITVYSMIGASFGVLTISYPDEMGVIIRKHVKRALYDMVDTVPESLARKLLDFAGLGSIT